jgi:hypothetical protein
MAGRHTVRGTSSNWTNGLPGVIIVGANVRRIMRGRPALSPAGALLVPIDVGPCGQGD